ncbi:LOW QUALITY PROTEIN: T-cell activation inhibitor, mitochondrial [Drosophila ficusphila]|uniref:LOW QUALITY PROTEIN: T-cell activation inhibitor, mitochondrial n=1 Tax=Drosophila ficusphila TaxID=30025 RepID=UPI0007E72A74|nr:LOW QUALITY PROTEIN: T-cell activation inhibitor, mitochondrial [Drosophila ficusphila]
MATVGFLGRRRIIDYCRRLLSTDLVTALRPFYQAIQTDRLSHSPAEMRVNEESLRLLSSHLESLTGSSGSCLPPDGQLEFYMSSGPEEAGGQAVSRLVRVQVDRSLLDPRAVIRNILRSCKLLPKEQEPEEEMVKELEKVLTKKKSKPSRERVRPPQSPGQRNFYALKELFKDSQQQQQQEHSLDTWVRQAVARSQEAEATSLRSKIEALEGSLLQSLGIRGTRYDCGCNMVRYHDCLRSLQELSQDQVNANQLAALRNRFVAFAPYTGISLEGDVMLFSGDSSAGWLSFLSEMRLHEEQLKLVPLYEKALSAVLLGIRIERRKVPDPGCEARAYAGSLKRVIRAVTEHLKLEESVQDLPATLQDHQLAIVPDCDAPKVSQTGLFLAPASCSGPDLVEFICRNLDVASGRFSRYRRDIQVERQLCRQCQEELGLQRLSKDDSVTPDKMVMALRHLLQSGIKSCRGLSLHVTNYWSVPTDGIVCIPWDFMSRKQ